jgi:RimJ/RimL family protein N-acetyltransferase
MKNTELLTSRRLVFRRFTEDDKKKDLDFLNHKNFSYFSPIKIKDKDKFIDQTIENYENKENFNLWYIVIKGENKPVGMAEAIVDGKTAQIKVLISERLKNRGYGSESLEVLIRDLMTTPGIEKILLLSQEENENWQEIIKKTHAKEEKREDGMIYYTLTNIDYMKYFALFGDVKF